MRQARIRNSLIVLLVAGCLTGLWWDTVIDPSARERSYDRIESGMTIPQVERLMRWPGEQPPMKICGDMDYHAQQFKQYGTPHLYRWEDAYSTVFVTFRAPAPNEPVVVSKGRTLKDPPDLDALLRWRLTLCFFWLLSLGLLLRGLLTPRPTDTLNSPLTSDATPDTA